MCYVHASILCDECKHSGAQICSNKKFQTISTQLWLSFQWEKYGQVTGIWSNVLMPQNGHSKDLKQGMWFLNKAPGTYSNENFTKPLILSLGPRLSQRVWSN